MATPAVILTTYTDGREITVGQVQEWIAEEKVSELSDFFYERLFRRYLKPFSFPSNDYKKNYKDGFSLMANGCLLIETYVSFKAHQLRNTRYNSDRCFGYSFVTESNFSDFATGGLSEARYLNTDEKFAKNESSGFPHEFYINVRCGILHNGETKNGWLIRREGKLFDVTNKAINATKFVKQLEISLDNFRNALKKCDFTDPLFKNYVNRLKDLISTT